MVNSNIRSGNKTVDDYIEVLEKELSTFSASNTKKLIRSIDQMAGKISSDLDLISQDQKNPDGTEVELSNKFVDTFIKMVEKADKIEAFSKVAENMYGVKIIEEKETTVDKKETVKPILQEGDNAFEKVIQKVKQKIK
jgi:hypothetical protein